MILRTRPATSAPNVPANREPATDGHATNQELIQTFLFDAAARFNESLLATIDATDTALIAVLACDVAIVVFSIDKLAPLRPVIDVVALSLLGSSMLICTAGYLAGRLRRVYADGVRPRIFVPDVTLRRGEAIVGALEQLIAAGETNLSLRLLKRTSVMFAIFLLLAALVVLSIARSSGGGVH
jgi:hypothetical protein